VDIGLTQAISNRVFRALDSLTTPIATFTPASRSVRTMLDSESGGPGSLKTRKDQDYERDDSIRREIAAYILRCSQISG